MKEHNEKLSLWLAVQKNRSEQVKLLLENKAEVNAKDNNGDTALSWAAVNGHGDIVKILLENKAEVNAKENNGRTALSWAAVNGRSDIVKILLENKAEVNAKENNDITPLHCAAIKGYSDIVKILLENKAEVNAKENNDITPLHWAAEKDYADIVKILLENKSEVNAKENNGRTALSWAAVKGHCDIVKILLQKEAEHTFLFGEEVYFKFTLSLLSKCLQTSCDDLGLWILVNSPKDFIQKIILSQDDLQKPLGKLINILKNSHTQKRTMNSLKSYFNQKYIDIKKEYITLPNDDKQRIKTALLFFKRMQKSKVHFWPPKCLQYKIFSAGVERLPQFLFHVNADIKNILKMSKISNDDMKDEEARGEKRKWINLKK